MLATDDMALSYSQQLSILLSINHALILLDGGSTTITYVREMHVLTLRCCFCKSRKTALVKLVKRFNAKMLV